MSETTATLPFLFRLVSMSPDPQNKTMRSNLESFGDETVVQVNLPQTAEFVANVDKIITEQLTAEIKENATKPILTPAGLAELYRLLSEPFYPKSETLSDEEWDEDSKSTSDENWSDDDSDNEDWTEDDDDEDWED